MIRRPLAPLWLSRPSRYAELPTRAARLALVLLTALILACFLALGTPGPPPASHDPAKRAQDQADVILYETIVDGVRHGGNYYTVAAEALRHGDYPLKPFVTFRLPTLAMALAILPPWAMPLLLYLLVALVAIAWWQRLKPAFARGPPLIIAMALLAGGLVVYAQADLSYFHEIWAGLFVALSLAMRQRGRWVESVSLGLVAVLIRETAAPYLAIMAGLALLEGQRREALLWFVTMAILAIALTLHADAVARVVRPLDPSSPGWLGLLGFGHFVRTMSILTVLGIAPIWLAAPLVGLALFGWSAWNEALALRALALFAAYAAILGIFGRTDTFYWGLIAAPTILVGLAFAPDGLRDLFTAALDKRRVTVKRIVR
ncbi:hypothetical protein [Sphingomonas bacterium]|uniref:hypothetical protein n=1 Tax=Sphingomonas bacterium TaxID=1895847 RepID=UPI001C2DE800|nr:hypothetical protein [Sphingomonas bacterium]